MKTHWKILLALLGTAGASLPSLFSYLASRSDSNEAKIRAEVAYVTTQEIVKELQDSSYEQALQLAEMKGELKALSRQRSELTAAPKPGHTVSGVPTPTAVAPEPPVQLENSQVRLRPKPPSFNEAVQTYKAKK